MSLRGSPQTGVAIPLFFKNNILILIIFPSIKEIATPVCALVRDDIYIFRLSKNLLPLASAGAIINRPVAKTERFCRALTERPYEFLRKVLGCRISENDQHTHQHTSDGGEGGQLAVVHQDGLGQDLAEDHIQHGTAGKAQAQGQANGTDLTQQIAQQGT